MKYFIDTEFVEGKQKTWFGRQTKPTIDLISIGIVAEDGREYYSVSSDFNVDEAWNRFDLKPDIENGGMKKVYWIRENVLLPIYKECISGDARNHISFSYSGMKWVIKNYGKTNKEIAKEVRNFVMAEKITSGGQIVLGDFYPNDKVKPEFYGYYSDYDWVVFCWLFGQMNDLPKGFPMYCIDLKQELERKRVAYNNETPNRYWKELEELAYYPKQTNEHNALDDARWNFELYKFLESL